MAPPRLLPIFLFVTIIAASQVNGFLLPDAHHYDPFRYHQAAANVFEPDFGFNHGIFEEVFNEMNAIDSFADHFWHNPTRYSPFGALLTGFTHTPSLMGVNSARYLPHHHPKIQHLAAIPANCQTPPRPQNHCPNENVETPVAPVPRPPVDFTSQQQQQRPPVHHVEPEYTVPAGYAHKAKEETRHVDTHPRVFKVEAPSSRPEHVTVIPRKDSASHHCGETRKHTTACPHSQEGSHVPTRPSKPAFEPVKVNPAPTAQAKPNGPVEMARSKSVESNKPTPGPHRTETAKPQNYGKPAATSTEQVRPVIRHQKAQGPNEPHIFRMGVPGFSSRNLHVRGFEDGNHVVVSGKVRCRKEDGNSCVPREVKETVAIPAGWDAAKAAAALQRGVLTVTVPVRETNSDGFVVVEDVDDNAFRDGGIDRVEKVTRVETAEDGVTLETLSAE